MYVIIESSLFGLEIHCKTPTQLAHQSHTVNCIHTITKQIFMHLKVKFVKLFFTGSMSWVKPVDVDFCLLCYILMTRRWRCNFLFLQHKLPCMPTINVHMKNNFLYLEYISTLLNHKKTHPFQFKKKILEGVTTINKVYSCRKLPPVTHAHNT